MGSLLETGIGPASRLLFTFFLFGTEHGHEAKTLTVIEKNTN